ncbi:MAG TPA: tyrosine-type recombinase/integrase [Acidobacteriaceae bacterium]|nr:tyrosine-type recombinase/integrase [Acidobacteriaceae bacterium]
MPLELKLRNGVYYIRGTVRGISVYESAKTRDREIAETVRAKREAEVTDESVFGKKATVTFAQAADDYVRAGGKSKYLLDILKDGTETGLVPLLGKRKLHTLRQADLDKAADKLRPGTSAATRNRCVYTPFIAVWNHAASGARQWADKRDWERPREPKGTAHKPTVTRSGTKPVSYEYAWQFVRAMSPAPACVLTALFYTGMRPIELFSLEAQEVDIEGRWIALPSTKTDEPRGVPIHEVLVPMFSALVKRGGVLFRTPRNDPYPLKEDGGGQLKSAINGARRRSGIKDISLYTARHTVSTQLVLNHVHVFTKDQILGHAVTDMSRNYTWIPQAPLIEAINTLPVIDAWRNAPWMADPVTWQRRFVRYENGGRGGEKRAKSVQRLPVWDIRD